MARIRIYLDTSVLSALIDTRAPDRMALTEGFFERRDSFDLAPSELTRLELGAATDPAKKSELLALLDSVAVFPITREMEALAGEYIKAGAFTDLQFNDSLHVAAAVVSGFQILVSWNFRHLVNRQRRLRVQAVNASLQLPGIEILSPPEV